MYVVPVFKYDTHYLLRSTGNDVYLIPDAIRMMAEFESRCVPVGD